MKISLLSLPFLLSLCPTCIGSTRNNFLKNKASWIASFPWSNCITSFFSEIISVKPFKRTESLSLFSINHRSQFGARDRSWCGAGHLNRTQRYLGDVEIKLFFHLNSHLFFVLFISFWGSLSPSGNNGRYSLLIKFWCLF